MKRFLKSKLWAFWAFLPVLSFMLGGCGREVPNQLQSVDMAMGTVIQQNIYAADGGDYTQEVLALIRKLEEGTLSWRLETAELYRVNQLAGSREGIALTDGLAEILGECLEVTENSEGAFDIALGPVARLWDIDGWAGGTRMGEFQVPDKQALKQALALCGSDRMRLQPAQVSDGEKKTSWLYLEEGSALDLGAVGKGLALDQVREYLESEPYVTGAVVSVGGSVLTYGEKPDGTAWRVGIADPFGSAGNLGVLTLTGTWCVSTSGDYERYVEADGGRYHHILDPATGYPADSGLTSVTVLTDNGLLSDALSTACFVLGREQGLLLAKQYGVEALFVEKDGSITMTPGMEPLFQALSNN